MQIHACALLDATGIKGALALSATPVTGIFIPLDVDCVSVSPAKSPELTAALPDSPSEKPVASGWLTGRNVPTPLGLWEEK